MWNRALADSRHVVRIAISLFIAVLWTASHADVVRAQASTGGVRGIVRDDTGAIMAGVTIEAASPARLGGAAVAVTDEQGMYRFENLPVGLYTVTFTLSGFTTIKQEGIRVEVGRSIE